MAALGEDLLATVNKLQDLVFNTIGNDSLDLPQIVRIPPLQTLPRQSLTQPRSSSAPSRPVNPLSSKTSSAETSCPEAAAYVLVGP